jgi:hypothetical protein
LLLLFGIRKSELGRHRCFLPAVIFRQLFCQKSNCWNVDTVLKTANTDPRKLLIRLQSFLSRTGLGWLAKAKPAASQFGSRSIAVDFFIRRSIGRYLRNHSNKTRLGQRPIPIYTHTHKSFTAVFEETKQGYRKHWKTKK